MSVLEKRHVSPAKKTSWNRTKNPSNPIRMTGTASAAIDSVTSEPTSSPRGTTERHRGDLARADGEDEKHDESGELQPQRSSQAMADVSHVTQLAGAERG